VSCSVLSLVWITAHDLTWYLFRFTGGILVCLGFFYRCYSLLFLDLLGWGKFRRPWRIALVVGYQVTELLSGGSKVGLGGPIMTHFYICKKIFNASSVSDVLRSLPPVRLIHARCLFGEDVDQCLAWLVMPTMRMMYGKNKRHTVTEP
jgi:hypothetical protein